MSAGDEDAIVLALNKIEQDIAQGKFEWVDGQDVHTNVMKALVNIVGEKAKVLTMMNQTDLCLSILTAWYKECIALITSRIKQIQVIFPRLSSILVMNFLFDIIII
jgi:argininosuccinate lyase